MDTNDRQADQRQQQVIYFAIALTALLLGSSLSVSSSAYFQRFFGETDPILVFIATMAIGWIALWTLQRSYGFAVLKGRETIHGISLSAAFATAFGVAIIAADFIIRYPQGINVPLPEALLFYPAIGFVAEIAFHILPMTLVLLALSPVAGRLGRERGVWIAILLAALAEPGFQVLFVGASFSWGSAYTWVHVFAFSLLQLYIFRRFDFVSMLAFRLIYYLYWHILWGTARLDLLF